jgi:RNA polymerase sigma-70 factor, ECF subfamily
MQPLAHRWNLSPLRNAADGIRPAEITASTADLLLIEQLRGGNEEVFVSLVERYHPTMLRLALVYVTERTVAEEVVQQTWRAVLEGLDQFEGHSCLKTWLFRTLIHCATVRAQREGRSLPFSSLPDDSALAEPTMDAAGFLPADHRWAGHWAALPSDWEDLLEEQLLSQETHACLDRAIETLPPSQRVILLLRDVAGWASDETCCLLGISEATQRVLLHHARSQVRRALERHFKEALK